jgi:hypothetical protein
MLNNVALDVAIGLIFIYMLYSLLATTIKEFIATVFSYRSRMLERGIEQMLDGRNYSYYWWDKVGNWILYWWQQKKIKNSGVIKAAMTKPDVQSNEQMQMFNGRVMINNPAATPNDPHYIKRRKLNDKAKLFTANITNHALYKRMAENSLFFKKPAYLSSDSFSDILIDILSEQKSTTTGTPVLMKDISAYVNDKLNNNSELKKILGIYIEQANGDLQRFKLLVEKWYDGTMDRVSGWYKKQATRVLLTIGFVMAMIFNISTVEIVKKLSESKPLRDAIVKNATEYVDTHLKENEKLQQSPAPAIQVAKNKKEIADSPAQIENNKNKPLADTVIKDSVNTHLNKPDTIAKTPKQLANNDSVFAKAKRQVEEMKQFYKESLEENNNLLGLGWGDYDYKKDSTLYHDSLPEYNRIHSSWFSWFNCKGTDSKELPKRSGWFKFAYVIKHSLFNWVNLVGFIITAFAISLGAPFWFDLLNKFINIRVSGKKPEESTPVSKTANLNKNPDPTAKG